MPRKNTLKVNEIKTVIKPKYRFEVMIQTESSEKLPFSEVVDVYAHTACEDGDNLSFFLEEDEEYVVACFKNWSYFIRREKEGECVPTDSLPKADIVPLGSID